MTTPKIERMRWDDYYAFLKRRAKPGNHGVIVGSTRCGKTVLAREVVPLFGHNIAVFDGKGGDDPSLSFPGFRRITAWPPPEEFSFMRAMTKEESRRPIRVQLAPKVKGYGDLPKMRGQFAKALTDLFTRKGSKVYAIYVDEMQIIADPREGMGLGGLIAPLIRTKGFQKMSVITATQYPTWIPKSSYRETLHRWFFPIQDEESQKNLGMMSGQRALIFPVLGNLRRYEFLYQYAMPGANRFIVSKVEAKR